MLGSIRPGRMTRRRLRFVVALSAQLPVNFEADQNETRIGTVAATEENVAEMCEGGRASMPDSAGRLTQFDFLFR
jgi:hypothetical protein